MVISSIIEELESARHPVAKPLHKSESGRVLCIGFKKDMFLKEHHVHKRTTLLVIKGSIDYIQEGEEHHLFAYDEYVIPIDMKHSVRALEDSLILLIQM